VLSVDDVNERTYEKNYSKKQSRRGGPSPSKRQSARIQCKYRSRFGTEFVWPIQVLAVGMFDVLENLF
jgi:hypothetical protein